MPNWLRRDAGKLSVRDHFAASCLRAQQRRLLRQLYSARRSVSAKLKSELLLQLNNRDHSRFLGPPVLAGNGFAALAQWPQLLATS
jgi:hypothetical protein